MNQFYWSLLTQPGFVQAAIWTIENKTTKVLGMGKSVPWGKPEDLIEATDKTLSQAISEFAGEEEPEKTVFGVPSSWVAEGQIKSQYLDLLREVCGKLSLQPVGFVVLPEAIAHFVKSEEETPLNGIIIGVGAESLDLAVFKLGNLVGSVSVGRSEDLVSDVVEGLVRFKSSEALPSRMLIYDGLSTDLEKARQSLIKADWTGELATQIKFLHTPTVEIIDPEKKTVAVCLAGASEMAEVTKVLFAKSTEAQEVAVSAPQETKIAHEFLDKISAQDAGFVMDQDVNVVPAEQIPQNIAQTLTAPKKIPVSLPVIHLGKLKQIIKRIKLPLPQSNSDPTHSHPHLAHPISISGPQKLKRPVVFVAVGLFILLIAGLLAWWFLPKAEVTVYISPRQIQKTATLTLGDQIPVSDHEVVVDGERTAQTTGQKKVGEKAKGKVEIRNGTSVEIKVAANTILSGPNNLKFNLDEAVTVPEASSPSSPGSVEVGATAAEIGAEHNIAKDEALSVGNYPKSDVDARVVDDFSGGSSREITAVSADDQNNLLEELTAELLDQGRNQLSSELADDEVLIGESIITQASNQEYSNKVGDEASTLRLSMALSVSVQVVKKPDLFAYAQTLLNDQITEGFVLRENQLKTDFAPKSTTDESLVYEIDFMANLLPETDTDAIKKKIAGKSKGSAQAALSSIPGFSRAVIKLIPSLPGRLAVVPHVEDNITIEVSSE